MPDLLVMWQQCKSISRSGVFITFPGNCRAALTFYQSCFGGMLHFDVFEKVLDDFTETPVIIGSLVSDRLIIHGSDLVHNEGRKIGNHVSIFLPCRNVEERSSFGEKLAVNNGWLQTIDQEAQILLEVTDAFQVNWVLSLR